jgi:benzylsuccinate CoA-transferase BbsF subunit
MWHGALSDVRVLDFTRVLAGPFATRMLADHGAEVIKVQSGVTLTGPDQNSSGYFNNWNRNKLGITLNLGRPEGIELAKKLVSISDVVVENFTPRVMANWGLDYTVLSQVRPDLIMLSLSGMGQTGPWRDYAAFGATVQALSGITWLTGFPDRPALGLGYAYADHVAGLMGVLAVMRALDYRQQTGTGQYIDLSETEAMCSLLGAAIMDYTCNGVDACPAGNAPLYRVAAPHGVYRCDGEDRWCAITVRNDGEWEAFCRVVGRESWMRDPRFASQADRSRNAAELDASIEEWTLQRSAGEVMRILQEVGIAAGVVQDAGDLAWDPQLASRRFFVPLEHPVLGQTVSDASPIRLSDAPARYIRAAPTLGQDNEYVFRELLGMSPQEFEYYLRTGVIS